MSTSTPRNIVFVAPFPMGTTMRFAAALHTLDEVRLLGLFQQAPHGAAHRLFGAIQTVSDAMDVEQLRGAIQLFIEEHGPIARIVGVLENVQEQLAELREFFGIEGESLQTARLFRDKALMKEALSERALPCARFKAVESLAEARNFAAEVGFPLVVKPPAGAGCRSTWKVEHLSSLEQAVRHLNPREDRPVLLEEFLLGDEYSFETLVIDGLPCFHSISRYYPSPIEVMANPWLQWVCILPRELGPEFDDARELAFSAVTGLGLQNGLAHMEWFRQPDQRLAIGEIALRPPGAQIVRMMSYAYETDFFHVWARAMVDGAFDGPFERKHAVGVAFLRGAGRGRIQKVHGVSEAQAAVGDLVVEADLPVVGRPKADGYEGDGWVIVRASSTKEVEAALLTIVQTIQISYTDAQWAVS